MQPGPVLVPIRLLSQKGRLLETRQLPPRMRRPTLQQRTREDGVLSVFVCDGFHNGAWEYRRVGVEREY